VPAHSISFDRAADYYDATRGFPPGIDAQAAALIVKAGSLSQQSRVLEIGIGTGRIALPLASQVGAVYGIDLSDKMMSRLREKQTSQPVYLTQGDATHLPYASSSFDAAVAVHVFHLMPEPELAVNELARTLRPGAPLLHCRTTHGDALHILHDAWNAVVGEKSSHNNQWQRSKTLLADLGWQMPAEPLVYLFNNRQSPKGLLARYEQRLMSSTWQISDAVLAAGIEAVKAAISTHFYDPDEMIDNTDRFLVEVYFHPQ
jgi:ubiquinone/menaquinone biosynthesis C-methylase UbiE